MNTVVMVLRAIHLLCGVYWAGTLFFLVTLLQPSVADAGPEGGKVQHRRKSWVASSHSGKYVIIYHG